MIARAAVLALVFAAASTAAHAEPHKEQYELQERCGKRTEQMYENEKRGKTGANYYTYQSHYNPTRDKCFYLPKENIITGSLGSLWIDLVDANENKTYGQFIAHWLEVNGLKQSLSVQVCYVQGETCSSESEWQELIKPYMEDPRP